MGEKYDVSGLSEAQYEPGPRRLVIKNMLGIKKKSEMDRLEAIALKQAEDALFRKYGARHCFTAKDICQMHKLWLGKIYPWAGHYRKVNISKGSFPFAAAAYIPQLMEEFEKEQLAKYTSCNFRDKDKIIRALAEVQVEFILIHPFREGNGRIARLIATLMVLQAGLPLLDFSTVKRKKKDEYFAAVRAGMDKNYKPMEEIFKEVLEVTLSRREGKR
ncbi:MAG: cell filamentation protein Fic [Omnitrophica WOR_2 bacterium RIFOXYC2_FULL_45_15]|nr:MAG: cell filamentation protein Fic [Omnitrophica WOR_2 bacterium RIFOXYC2_FULL_45_15]